jgi:hypothetical protein
MPIRKELMGGLDYIHADAHAYSCKALEGNIFMLKNSACLVISNIDNGLR